MSTWAHWVRVVGISVASSCVLSTGASAVVDFIVDSTLDQIDNNTSDGVCRTAVNTCTLRAAVMEANLVTDSAGATIVLAAGIYSLTLPATGADGPDSGDLNLTTPASGDPVLRILGAGQSSTVIDANHQNRIFEVRYERTAWLAHLTLRNGYVSAGSVGGGGILNDGSLFLIRSTVSGNEVTVAGGDGGGILNLVNLYVDHCTISGNSSGGQGGGIYSNSFASIAESTIVANVASRDGGGILSSGFLHATDSTISLNTSHGDGGGIYSPEVVGENLTLIQSTIYGNNADGSGGGIYFGSPPQFNANVFSSTIAGNSADVDADQNGGNGGGVYVGAGSNFHLRNTLIVGNTLFNQPIYNECWGTLNSYGTNLFWEWKASDQCFIVPQSGIAGYLNSLDDLGPLQFNGGPTQTIALLPGSNAIDTGDPELGCIGPDLLPFATDQRGAARVLGVRCDVGAYEAGTLFFDGFESGDLSAW